MNKVDTSDITTGVAYPPSKKGFDFLQNAHIEIFSVLAQAISGDPGLSINAYILYGCEKTDLGGGNFQFNEGWIYDGNTREVYFFEGTGSIAIADEPVLTITTTPDPTADPTTFTDGSTKDVHDVRTLVVSDGALGSADINYADLLIVQPTAWINKVISIGDIAVSAGTYTVIGGTYTYKIVGKVMYLRIRCNLSSPATTNTYFDFTIPGGYSISAATGSVGYSEGDVDEFLQVIGSTNKIRFNRLGMANFAAYTTGTELFCSVTVAL